jgi:4-hydroxythreonine-4-phosphate dehydrogenase
MSESKYRPIVGISLGDINGIGPEIVLKTLQDSRLLSMMTPVVYGSSKVLGYYKKALKIQEFRYQIVQDSIDPEQINVVNCWQDMLEISTGQTTEAGGQAAFMALDKATTDLTKGIIQALVTAPINKHNIQRDDFNFPGHTEFLTQASGAKDSLMLLCTQNLRVGVVTGHIPIAKVAQSISKERISSKLNILEKTLRQDFGIGKPRIAVLGLNPHAGENGILGNEEQKIIEPVVQQFKEKSKLIFGPYPADGFFGSGQYKKFDGILAMYHDQGLIPFKTLAFENGVNYTAGLSIVRTSPDHGTAYDIAGKGQASEVSFREALYMACDVARRRRENGKG